MTEHLRRLLSRLYNALRPGRAEPDLARELSSHLRLIEDDFLRRGLSADKARLAARLAFGGVEQVKDVQRDARSLVWLDDLRRDLSHATRLLRRNPVFALTAAISLAIGIGASTVIFTAGNSLLLRTAPGVADPDRLIDVVRSEQGHFGIVPAFYGDYGEFRQRATTLAAVYAYQLDLDSLSLGSTPNGSGQVGAERIFSNFVTSNYFEALGVRPALGRLFDGNEMERPDGPPIVALSHRFWTRRFNADPAIIGQTLILNGRPLTVIGVAPPEFSGLSVAAPDIWLPAGMSSLAGRSLPALQLTIGARLRDGVSRGLAAAEIDTLGRVLERERPSSPGVSTWRVAAASPIPANLRLVVAGFLALLMSLVGLVLAISCANVASVLLARAVARRREMAVRVAMGAGRGRLLRQLLTEALLLFTLGGSAGLLLARAISSALPALLPTFAVPVAFSLALDARVLAFTAALSLVAAMLSGVAPALHASKADVVSALKDEGEGPADRPWLRHVFVVSQVAFSILLVVASGVFMRALDRLSSIERGFDPRGVELMQLDLALGGYTDATGGAFTHALADRVRELPEVESATVALAVAGGPAHRELRARPGDSKGRLPAPQPGRVPDVSWNSVAPGYFATMRIPVTAGRDFTAADRADTQPVAIVSEAAARRLWRGEPALDAVGREIPRDVDTTNPMRTPAIVVGIARDVSTGGGEPRPTVYVPLQQRYSSNVTVIARAATGRRLAGRLRALVASMNPNLPILTSQTLEEQLMSGPVPMQLRVAASVSASVGLIGLLLAGIGIYGVTAYSVVRRTREIGIRLALGAQHSEVAGLIVRQGMSLVALGSAIGLALAAAAGRLLTRLLFGAAPIDFVTFAAAVVVFAAVGLAACYVPARRAVGVDPVNALRHE